MSRRLILLTAIFALLLPAAATAFDAATLWSTWPQSRFVDTPAPCLRHEELTKLLDTLEERHGGLLRREIAGTSVEGRSISLLSLGQGSQKVLLWSQMHGDEPSATPAVLDLIDYLLSNAEAPEVAQILDQLTILAIPMLNPDGAQAYTRQNAQGIDINRDALSLASPEGRLLKQIRDTYQPILGFNLHDQNRRRTAGTTRVLASTSVLAVTGDEAQTWTPGRLLAKRASAAIATTLGAFTPGGIGRFDASWSERAFGDNLTTWGTPVVLIESGAAPPGGTLQDLTRLNYVALATVLRDLAHDRLGGHDPDFYDQIPENSLGDWTDLGFRGGRVLQPSRLPSGPAPSYPADLSIDLMRSDQADAGCAPRARVRSRIVEVGDARTIEHGRRVDTSGQVIVPAFAAAATGWRARRFLDAPSLERLATLGVGTISWQVPARKFSAALAHARALEGNGRPRVEVSTEERAVAITLTATPGAAAHRLSEMLVRLAPQHRDWATASLGEVLPLLVAASGQGVTTLLRPGSSASFLLLDGGGATPETAKLEELEVVGVWIDGHEVAR